MSSKNISMITVWERIKHEINPITKEKVIKIVHNHFEYGWTENNKPTPIELTFELHGKDTNGKEHTLI